MSAHPLAHGLAILRAARAGDRAAIERLLAESALPTAGVEAALAGFVVAEERGTIVGAAGLEPAAPYALLRSVVVAASWRGTGLGATLVRRLLADADSRDVPAVYLLTTTAERWFPRFGFAPVTRNRVPDSVRATGEYREGCPATAIVMRRSRPR